MSHQTQYGTHHYKNSIFGQAARSRQRLVDSQPEIKYEDNRQSLLTQDKNELSGLTFGDQARTVYPSDEQYSYGVRGGQSSHDQQNSSRGGFLSSNQNEYQRLSNQTNNNNMIQSREITPEASPNMTMYSRQVTQQSFDKTFNENNVTRCMNTACGAKFGFMMSQRHQCVFCFRILCSNCSSKEFLQNNRQMDRKRICKRCFQEKKDLDERVRQLNERNEQMNLSESERHEKRHTQRGRNQNNATVDMNNSLDTSGHGESPQKRRQDRDRRIRQEADFYAQQSRQMAAQLKEQQENEENDTRMALSRSQTRRASNLAASYRTKGLGKDKSVGSTHEPRPRNGEVGNLRAGGDLPLTEEHERCRQQLDDMYDKMYEYMDDIQNRVLKEFNIDIEKWDAILKDFVKQAILTVKPQSYINKNSMDICKYVKIQLIEYKDTSKCKYVNGVVIKKSLAHKRMQRQIENPRMIILANSLGYMKDDEEFIIDLETELKQEETHLQIILRKIQAFKPNLIIAQKDISERAREELFQMGITCIKNVKKSVIDRIERLTKTPALPNINLLSKDFLPGKCQNFYVESLRSIALNKNYDHDTDIIFLDGCEAFLGCTLLLSSNKMDELKVVKHALKKILRLSRQLVLEFEYYQLLSLVRVPLDEPSIDSKDRDKDKIERDVSVLVRGNSEKQIQHLDQFLHQKHMERDFLIFKEVSFSKRGVKKRWEDDEHEDIVNIEIQKKSKNEKHIQEITPRICQVPQMRRVKFYNEEQNDLSLGRKLHQLYEACTSKCPSDHCDQYLLYHTHHFYHKTGYVEMTMRLSKEVPQDPQYHAARMKNPGEKQMFINCWCTACSLQILSGERVSRQLQELSFYSFLEQFFYNTDDLRVFNESDPYASCPHGFHPNAQIIFVIGVLRVDFRYHPVDIYSLDLICFRDQQGTVTPSKALQNFYQKRKMLLTAIDEGYIFIRNALQDLQQWFYHLGSLEQLKTDQALMPQARHIIDICKRYLDNIEVSVNDYSQRAAECVRDFKANNEFYLNKLHHLITQRTVDYLFIILNMNQLTVNELNVIISSMLRKTDKQKLNKKDVANLLIRHLSGAPPEPSAASRRGTKQVRKDKGLQPQTPTGGKSQLGMRPSPVNVEEANSAVREHEPRLAAASIQSNSAVEQPGSGDLPTEAAETTMDDKTASFAVVDMKKRTSTIPRSLSREHALGELGNAIVDLNNAKAAVSTQQSQLINSLVNFEETLKSSYFFKEFMKMSPSISAGVDLNCAQINFDDLSTIICQSLVSTQHVIGLKEHGYMDIESKLDKYKHVYKQQTPQYKPLAQVVKMHHDEMKDDEYRQTDTNHLQMPKSNSSLLMDAPGKVKASSFNGNVTKPQPPKVVSEEFYVFKENHDIMNKEMSQKEIETELLRLEHFNFQISFNNYKGPMHTNLELLKDNNKSVKVEKNILTSPKVLEPLEKLMPADLEPIFYHDLNTEIANRITLLKCKLDASRGQQVESHQREPIHQDSKYRLQRLFADELADVDVTVFYPTHFQALRKLYCGSFNLQLEQLFKSSFWSDNTGGKSKSEFYKSYNEKFVMKVIGGSEMRRFNDFAPSYFEYMCRSFNQKCPTSIAKILGAFKVTKTSQQRSTKTWHLILMESVTIGLDQQNINIAKYDLKGSMSNRYVVPELGKTGSTKLDTNFLEDRDSKPICMNYTMNRLMEIAIHNDTSFLHRYGKLDYSLLVWIDHENKLVRVGIIDYIQSYTVDKQFESKFKQAIYNNKPTILDPKSYKERFKRAMSNYFMSILSDQPSESFAVIVKRQMERKEARLAQSQKELEEVDEDQIVENK